MAGSREAHVAARRRLIMLRHGQTSYNATGRIQGQLDTQLSDVGREQARTAAQYLAEAEPRITKIVSSDLTRAADTARALAEATGAELSFDKRLRETNLGEWQERTYDEIDSSFPGMRDHWRHNLNWVPKGGETRFEVSNRMLAVIAELAANPDWESDTFVLVSHGGAIAAATAALLQLPRDYFSTFNGLGNTAWVDMEQRTRVNGETSWYLNAFNAKVRARESQVSDSSGGRHAR
ncbi:fructose-2,6-bisphosphatase [Corynebacterium sp. HMSC074C05]|uniref:histidine phosphatase family protein n=1 Tax=Corynebacterium sp. HMSC074C05 TaxID=1739534 RepID=UPI0008A9DA52|nr:histidine phosphatase family protein [Corynebacterium sp. HMSC074C05]OHR35136.1 fructose-2,6-bisphosphatase [Corynebacterium sp. HMSC074C05]